MKAVKTLLVTIIGLSIVFYSCDNDEMHNELSQEDLESLNGLRDAYTGAFEANTALKVVVQQSDADGVHFHDSVFHHFEGLFEEHHENYTHANQHDDHHHDEDGMHMGSNAMNMHGNEDGHHNDDHELMDDLMTVHEATQH